MKRRTILGTLAPLSLAGCMRLQEGGGDQDDTAGETTSVTDDTEEDEATGGNGGNDDQGSDDDNVDNGENDDDEISYPNGLREDGPSPLLASAHSRELIERSFTMSIRTENLSSGWWFGKTIHYDGERAHIHKENRNIEFYFADGTEWWRQRQGGQYVYGQPAHGSRGSPWFSTDRVALGIYLEAFIRGCSYDAPVVDDERDPPRFIIDAHAVANTEPFSLPFQVERVEQAEGVLEVDADSVIRSFEGEFVGIGNGEERLLSAYYSLSDLDETTVSEPEWIETASERAPGIDASLEAEGSYVAITHTGGDPILSGTYVSMSPNDASFEPAILNDSFEAGETRYLWIDDGAVTVSTSSPDESTRTILADWRVSLNINRADYVSQQLYEF